jgi:hypothetical protein
MDTNKKLVEARCWLRFVYGERVNRWQPKAILKEMALQGFIWDEQLEKWFARLNQSIEGVRSGKR